VERRISILEEHMWLAEPTVEDADRAAKALGVTRISFYRLLRTWKNDRDPAKVGVPAALNDAAGDLIRATRSSRPSCSPCRSVSRSAGT
jgi:hypothetical protein